MFPGLAAPAQPQTAANRIVTYSGCVSISFLAGVLITFHGRLHAPKNTLAERGITTVAGVNAPRVAASYGKLPLSFEVNGGQTDPQVRFLSRGRGYTLFLTGDEAVLTIQKPSAVSYQQTESRDAKVGIRGLGVAGYCLLPRWKGPQTKDQGKVT